MCDVYSGVYKDAGSSDDDSDSQDSDDSSDDADGLDVYPTDDGSSEDDELSYQDIYCPDPSSDIFQAALGVVQTFDQNADW